MKAGFNKHVAFITAWHHRRIYANRKSSNSTATFSVGLLERCFTLHACPNRPVLSEAIASRREHLYPFTLINMNGRAYDPLVGRFLSPDPYIQAPDNTQNLNRYSYCLNNPLKYTDPSGELIFGVINFVKDFITNAFTKGGLEFWNPGRAIKVWTNGHNWNSTTNAFKIDFGLIKTDPHKSFLGQIWEVWSRFTWQLPQTAAGYSFSQVHNTFNGVKSVNYYGGATVVESYSEGWGGITLGSYINGQRGIKADPSERLFQHEYGHYIQSQSMGWAYFPRVGIPSIRSKGAHVFHAVEQDANRRAFLYFNKNIEGFQDDAGLWDNRGWNFWSNPLNINGTNTRGQYVDYRDPKQVNSLDILKVRAKWYDHASWLLLPVGGPIWVGLINSGIYNR